MSLQEHSRTPAATAHKYRAGLGCSLGAAAHKQCSSCQQHADLQGGWEPLSPKSPSTLFLSFRSYLAKVRLGRSVAYASLRLAGLPCYTLSTERLRACPACLFAELWGDQRPQKRQVELSIPVRPAACSPARPGSPASHCAPAQASPQCLSPETLLACLVGPLAQPWGDQRPQCSGWS